MATIDSLNKSISQMDKEEYFDFIMKLRGRRLIIPPKPKKQIKVSTLPAAETLVSALSEEQKEELLKLLGGDGSD